MSKGVLEAVELVAAVVATVVFGQPQIGLALASAALSTDTVRRSDIKAKNAYNASLRDRYAMTRSTQAARQLVFGRCRVSGPMFFASSFGDNKEHITFCVALAAHEVAAIETVYFDDQPVTLDGFGNVQGVRKQDSFSIAAPTATVTLTTTPFDVTVTAEARYGSDLVPLTVTSVSGVSVSVSGARVGQTGELDVYYKPRPDPFAPDSTSSSGERFTITSSTQTFTMSATPNAGGLYAVYVATTPDSDDAFPVTVSSVSGNNVTLTGMTVGRSVVVYYQTSASLSKARVRKYLGAPGQTADAGLIASFPGVWTSAHTVSGVAYLVVELDYDEDAFTGGVPNVSAVVRGMKCYDPRNGTTAWTENPALHARALAIHPLAGNLPTSSVDDAAVAVAAGVCSRTATYTVGGTDYVRQLYKSGYAHTTDRKPMDGLTDLCQAMGGSWVFADGMLRLAAGAYRTPNPGGLDETWLVDDQAVTVQAGNARADLVNTITGSIADELQDWRTVPLPRLSPSAYTDEDGATLARDIQYAAVTFSGQGQYIASCQLRQMRQGLVFKARCNLRAWQAERFDVLNVTLPRFGWASKPFEVLEDTWTADGAIELTLRETSPEIWDMDAGFSANDIAPNTNMPKPWGLPLIAGLTANSGDATLLRQSDGTIVPRMSMLWAPVTDDRVLSGGYVEIRYWRAGDSVDTFETVKAIATENQVYLTSITPGSTYIITARTVSAVTQSDWCAQIAAQTYGKSNAPADVTSLTAAIVYGAVFLTWDKPPDTDYAQTELRQGASWAAGVPLSGSLPTVVRGMSYLWAWPMQGSYTVWARHDDTSGNESTTPVSVAVVVDSRINIHDSAIATASGVGITRAKHTPDGDSFRDNVVSLTYTPTSNCDAVLTLAGSGSYAVGAGNTLARGYFMGGIYIAGATWTGIDCTTGSFYAAAGVSSLFSVTGSKRFALTAGTAYTFSYFCVKFDAADSASVDNVELRLDVIKGV